MDSQQELFQAETHWFHVFKTMIDNGDLAKMDGSTVKVYLVVKAHTNFSTGRSFPALETIAEKSGLSVSQVKRCLNQLEDHAYITKEKMGRNNSYTLREKVDIFDEGGKQMAVATWDYLPSSVSSAVADLRKVLVTGDLAGAKIVNIEKLQVNIIQEANHSNFITSQNVNGVDIETLRQFLPQEQFEKLQSKFTKTP